MTDLPRECTEIVPQVGAILHLDTELYDLEDAKLGNKHWVLDGSCVLVAPDRILTVRHALDKTRTAAAFIPYVGIVSIDSERVEDYEFGDTVCLCRLEKEVTHVPPVPWAFVSRKTLRSALLTGYGRWTPEEGWAEDGVQRSVEVKLHLPGSRQSIRYGGNLDINWWSEWNRGLGAGRNNSGGPMLSLNSKERILLGLTRESKQGQQAASRISRDRDEWLSGQLGSVLEMSVHRPPIEMNFWNLGVSEGHGEYQPIDVPRDATGVQVTLSATPGLRLQMGLDLSGDQDSFLGELVMSDHQSGRFLCRGLSGIPPGTETIWVGIAPVAQAPVRKEEVQAQLCCMFT